MSHTNPISFTPVSLALYVGSLVIVDSSERVYPSLSARPHVHHDSADMKPFVEFAVRLLGSSFTPATTARMQALRKFGALSL